MGALTDRIQTLVAELSAVITEYEATGRLDTFSGDLRAAEARLRASGIGGSVDFVLRTLRIGGSGGSRAILAHVQGTDDPSPLDGVVLQGLMAGGGEPVGAAELEARLLPLVGVAGKRRWPDIFAALAAAQAVLFVEGIACAYALDVAAWPSRGVGTPVTEVSIKGAQDAFAEPLQTNLALLRR